MASRYDVAAATIFSGGPPGPCSSCLDQAFVAGSGEVRTRPPPAGARPGKRGVGLASRRRGRPPPRGSAITSEAEARNPEKPGPRGAISVDTPRRLLARARRIRGGRRGGGGMAKLVSLPASNKRPSAPITISGAGDQLPHPERRHAPGEEQASEMRGEGELSEGARIW